MTRHDYDPLLVEFVRLLGIPMTKQEDKQAAYHESAHTVVGFEFGWHLHRSQGVHIGKAPQAALRRGSGADSEQADTMISMAGWVAEDEVAPVAVGTNYIRAAMYEFVLHKYKIPHPGFCGDGRCVERAILKAYPLICERNFLGLMRKREKETKKLVKEPRIWGKIEIVAGALLERRHLTHHAVVALIGRPNPLAQLPPPPRRPRF
jgi:hypothetical protein